MERRRRTKFGLVRRRKSHLYGALDLGTNNCRLLIAKPTGPGFRVIASFSRIVRLGEGLAVNGELTSAAMNRTVQALKICAEKLKNFQVRKSRVVATEACRRAGNCEDFFALIREKTGLELEAISCDEEARLALIGCQSLLDDQREYALVFDIGGGSTEITWSKRNEKGGYDMVDMLSLPHGVVTLAETCGTEDVDIDHYGDMVRRISAELPDFCGRNRIKEHIAAGRVQMLGTSGTVTTLGALHLELPYYSRSRIDGLEVSFDDLDRATRRIVELDYDARCGLPCIGEERAELVVPGCAILEAICHCWPVGSLRIADRGLREGMLMELMVSDGVPIVGNPAAVEAQYDADRDQPLTVNP